MTRRPLNRILIAPMAVGLALVLAWSSPAGAGPAKETFADAIDEILSDPRLDGAQSSVVIADAATGDPLHDHHGADRLMPASNSKLLTSAAAFDVLGPDYTWTTEVHADGPVRGRVLRGDLYLRGTGDPTLLVEDYESLADQVAATGIRKVTGSLVADDTRFDDERFHWGWNVSDEQYYYGAPVSALTVAPDTDYDAGTVYVTITPGDQVGDPPTVSVFPETDHVTVENTATTAEAGTPLSLPVNRRHGEEVITVAGSIAADAAPVSVWRSVWDPTGHAAAVFTEALADRGITVGGGTRLGEAVPEGSRELAVHKSMTVAELMNPFMKLSNNGHAEVLIKTMGHETEGSGSWSAGTRAATGALARWGLDTSTYVLADGSGLTRRNWVPAEDFATLLLAVQEEKWFGTFRAALPVACDPDRSVGGTLRLRMCGTPAEGNVHAKTGSLTGATALSGYVTDADGRDLVFSIVLNYYMGPAPKDIEDRIVVTLASYRAGDDGSGGPEPLVSVPLSGIEGEREADWVKPEDLTTAR
ncbi:D-alanyl-D-alanine carboxypeptidase/D-alanyl-D-alanine-endopeptidase [Streptomyces sp. ACA25]|uniref:D-alanyl-D-alanine carboxypeptidase/D-alanyl-D-alanine endopeptidase n=1 Tax=Streptomyces sp. ACA25 TaxID=3022596 RepID=UPI0023070248|nr:D-alanyl-D-alanine carboxypeptidase/D-alanyl-D-alanine-endopeptidase [Streptomyces sp. ACA25]MDB1090237.1 D-alanyl-D-alanine carboxypeptidase/D-alanyl-D-alanine-endopeptidase [Streptomyces sp. ACA25]